MAARGNNSAAELAVYADRFVPVFDDGYVQVFENPRALPRAHLVPCGGIEVQEFQRRAISRVNSPAFDHTRMVVLDDTIACPVDRSSPAARGRRPAAEVIQATFNTYVIRADVAVPSLLVYADTYYEGWRARVDDREAPIVGRTTRSRRSWSTHGTARRPLRLRPVDVPLGRRDHAGGAGDRGGAARLVRLAPDAAAGR